MIGTRAHKPLKIALLILSCALAGIFGSLWFYYGYVIIEVQTIPMDATVGSKIGFNADTDALHFGTVYPGGEIRRSLILRNRNPFEVQVLVTNHGPIAPYISLKDTDFMLGPLEETTIGYTLQAPQDTIGMEGYTKVLIKRDVI